MDLLQLAHAYEHIAIYATTHSGSGHPLVREGGESLVRTRLRPINIAE